MKKHLLLLLSVILLSIILTITVGCGKSNNTTAQNSTGSSFHTSDISTDTYAPPLTGSTTAKGTESTPASQSSSPSATSTPETSTKAPDTTTQTPNTTETKPVVPEPKKGTRILVKYEINNPYAGSLKGSSSQTLRYGETSSTAVSLTTNLGYKFIGWSDGSTETSRVGDCPKQDTTYTAIFEYDAKELPIISLFTDNGKDVTDKENYVTGSISVYNAGDDFNFEYLDMEIRGRGNYTWKSTFKSDPMYNKRPYRLKLSKKTNLLGQGDGKSKSWVLIANHCDQSLLRNQTVMNFAKSLSGIVWEPAASSVEVFLNGKYIGVYMLTEQVQIHESKLDLSEEVEFSDEIDFLAHLSNYAFDESDNTSFYYDSKPYEIVSDLSTDSLRAQRQMQYIQGRIGECWDAVRAGSKDRILALMDINSVIDTLIVHEFFKNLDTGHDNFYMFASVDGKLHFGPVWDFDQCAGNANIGVESYEGLRGSQTNPWYVNFLKLDWFKEMFRARWDEIYEDYLSAVPDTIRAQAQAGYESYCRNFEKWKILGYTDNYGNKQLGYKINREMEHIRIFQTYDEHYEYFAKWMENRLAWLNNYYHSPQFIVEKVELNLSGNGTESSPYLITSAKDFYNFTMVMLQGETFQGKYFKQAADIDMTTLSYYAGIGAPYIFAGTYDGAGHTIHADIKGEDGSFFPYLNGTVMNLMTTGSIRNSGHTGGIARSVRRDGKIINCGSTVTLYSSGGNAGGIASSNENGGGSVIGCWFVGKIVGSNSYGPIIVYVDGRITGIIQNNYYSADYLDFATNKVPATRAENETAVTKNQLGNLHIALTQNLQTVASLAKVDKNKLCLWKSGSGLPVPNAMN